MLILALSQGSAAGPGGDSLDPGLESGKWAIRFLLLCLAMTPLQTYFGWRSVVSLRKPAGLWAFGFAGLHLLLYLKEAGWDWLTWPLPLYLALGLLGLLILTALALTSNRWAMRRLKKQWKRLHRLVYLAGGAGAVHALLAAAASKKVMVYDPQAISELWVYLAVLVVLLALRLPLVKQKLIRRQSLRPLEQPLTPLPRPEPWPPLYRREVDVPLDDLVTAEITAVEFPESV